MTNAPPPSCTADEHAAPRVRRAQPSAAVLERAAGMLRAAGEPGRLALLEMLGAGALCVTDLAARAGDPLPAVSQRLRVLKGEGLVTARRDGKHVFYALADAHVRDLLDTILRHAGEPA